MGGIEWPARLDAVSGVVGELAVAEGTTGAVAGLSAVFSVAPNNGVANLRVPVSPSASAGGGVLVPAVVVTTPERVTIEALGGGAVVGAFGSEDPVADVVAKLATMLVASASLGVSRSTPVA
jgi:hypothetical protein